MSRLRTTPAAAIVVALLVAAVAVLAAELARGATRSGVTVANPCKQRALFPGHGIDATIQRIVLDGLDGAACRLRTSREELVLSLRAGGATRRWDQRTIETAVRAGLLRAVDEAERRGDIPGFIAPLVRRVVENAPIGKLVEGGIRLRDLFG
jgi:preprotein translocase subunit Sec61beta